MPQELSILAKSLVQNTVKTPNIVVDIEGVTDLYGAQPILEFIRWDQTNPEVFWDQDGIFWDGLIENDKSKSWIDLSGTTKSVTQQIYPDKQGASSVSSVNLKIIDKDRQVAKALSFDSITEILGKKCNLAYGFTQGEYPRDYLYIYRGVITDFYWNAGAINLTVASPETLKRQSIFTKVVTKISTGGAINDVVTSITVDDSLKFLDTNLEGSFTTFVRIDDEIMEVTDKPLANEITVIRNQLGTAAATHDAGAEVESFYVLGTVPESGLQTGNPIDLALKIMLSGTGAITGEVIIESIVYINPSLNIKNAIVFDDPNIQRTTGLVPGDTLNLTSGVNAGSYIIDSFVQLDNGRSYIVINTTNDLTSVIDAAGTTYTYQSQFDVLPDGLEMLPLEVDVAGFLFERDLNNLSLTNEMRFFLKDTLDDPKEFIDKELLFNSGFYGVPRDAKVGVKSFTPPLTIDKTPNLNTENILNLSDLSIRRSGHRYLFNRIDFIYNENVLEDNFLAYVSTLNTDSTDRIKLGKKVLRVESKGYPDTAEVSNILEVVTKRYLDRFKFASTYIENVKLTFKAGFNLEVGDVIFLGGGDTQLVNFETGERDLPLKKYEIVNKKLDLSGDISVSLVDTGFASVGIYGVISPSAVITSSTTTIVNITKTISDSDQFTFARDSFEGLIGAPVRIRSVDYTYDESTTIVSFPPGNPNQIEVDTLSVAPPTDAIIELDLYTRFSSDTPVNNFLKLKYVFFNKYNQEITGYPGGNDITVPDASGFTIGDLLYIYDQSYNSFGNATIANIVGNTITINDYGPGFSLGSVNDVIETRSYSLTEENGYFLL